MNPSISVAMCTFNGSRFLHEQLRSLVNQSRAPDELVVCDDASTDGTAELLEGFRARAPFSVKLVLNAHQLGSTKNFEQAISLCSGSLILLADQDDLWLPHKIRRIEQCFVDGPNVGLVFSDAEVVDDRLRPQGYRLWRAIHFSPRLQRKFDGGWAFHHLLRANVVTGATLGFRSHYRDFLLPIPELWVHDSWIALLLSAVSGVRTVSQPLVMYRQHEAQQIGVKNRGLNRVFRVLVRRGTEPYHLELEKYQLASRRLSETSGSIAVPMAFTQAIEQKTQHLLVRTSMPRGMLRRLRYLVPEIVGGRYFRYSLGWLSIARDLLS